MRSKKQAKEEINKFSSLVFDQEKALSLQDKWLTEITLKNGRAPALFLELCMGAGRFITELAKQNPSSQFLGLEIKEERILKAVKKVVTGKLSNIRFIWGDFRNLTEFFKKESLNGIYINFSDPWPKKKHHKRRASTLEMINVYYDLLKPGAFLQIKHDNPEFVAFTLEHLEQSKFQISENREIAPTDPDNITTEYEERWRGEGRKIWLVKGLRS